jgi:hypothetical protein
MFDGAALLTPASHSDVVMDHFDTLGKILSHGYFLCGFIPSRIAFPVLACVLLGSSVCISQNVLLQSFADFLSNVDREVITDALKAKEFTQNTEMDLINVLARFGSRDMPTPSNLKRILLGLAEHLFRSQPFAAISKMSSGIPASYREFWNGTSVEDLYQLSLPSWPVLPRCSRR